MPIGAVVFLLILTFLPAHAGATVPDFLAQVPQDGQSGAGAGRIGNGVRAIAADPTLPGNVFVADAGNRRVDVFTPWGVFVKAFGWSVNATDPQESLQECTTETGCEAGSEGAGAGQFNSPGGIAVDSNGHVYVAEGSNQRVQKFSTEGDFELMFGYKVNRTAEEEGRTSEENICPAAGHPGDLCQAGTAGSGSGQLDIQSYHIPLATSPLDGAIYVGDAQNERIQVFDPDGSPREEIALPSDPERDLVDIAFDVTGKLYAGFKHKYFEGSFFIEEGEVRKLEPTGPNAQFLTPTFAASPAEARSLDAIAVDSAYHTYAVTRGTPQSIEDGSTWRVLEFDAVANCLGCGSQGEGGKPGFDRSPPSGLFTDSINAIGTGSACGAANIYTLHIGRFEIYGPPPNPSLCPAPAAPPKIAAQFAAQVDTTSAELRAGINPNFWNDTKFYVEYGTSPCSEGGCNVQPEPPGSTLTTKVTNAEVTTAGVFLSGLVPGTTYHYRFVAQSGGGGPVWGVDPDGPDEATFENGVEGTFTTFLPEEVEPCPENEAFRTGAAALLPDCRAYEMVSPLDKEGGDIYSLGGFAHAFSQGSTDGDRFVYGSYRAFADALAAPIVTQYLAARKADGWHSHYILGPRERLNVPIIAGLTNELQALSPDLCQAWTKTLAEPPLAPAAQPGQLNLYRRIDQECGGKSRFEVLTTAPPPHGDFGNLQLQGVSADGSKAIYVALDNLTADAPEHSEKQFSLYYQKEGEGSPHFVCYGTDGKPVATACTAGTLEREPGSATIRLSSLTGAISADGERVFWTAFTGTAGDGGPGEIFLRLRPGQLQSTLNGEGKCKQPTRACTIAVSAKGEELSGTSESWFWLADADGSKAIFSTGSDLYEFDVASETTTLIAHESFGVMGASEDASRLYFGSEEALPAGPNSEGDVPQAGKANLYLREGGALRFVATLASRTDHSVVENPVHFHPLRRASRVSPDGLHAAFISSASLTGYDNAEARSGNAATEVFLYDAAANEGQGKLLCASCNPSGARPIGEKDDQFNTIVWRAARLPVWNSSLYPGRLLSDDGTRLYFESIDRLVPRDSNGAIDVYQWEAPGAGSCDEGDPRYSPLNQGCVSLISSGQSPDDAVVLDAGATGDDVFFTTGASLREEDYGLVDVYDARAGGGLPSPPKPPVECEGEACQAPAQAPGDPTPASASFQGAGNLVEGRPGKPRCRRGKVRRRGRCVRKRTVGRASAQRRPGR